MIATSLGKEKREMRCGRGRAELVDRRLQVTDHKKYGVESWHELLLGAQHGE